MSLDTEIRPACDACKKSYVGVCTKGGMIFNGRPIGPCCSADYQRMAANTHEKHFIEHVCPPGQSFCVFVRWYYEQMPREKRERLIAWQKHIESIARKVKKEKTGSTKKVMLAVLGAAK